MTLAIKDIYGTAPPVGSFASCSCRFPKTGRSFSAFSIVVKLKSNGKPTYAHIISTKHDYHQSGVKSVVTEVFEKKDERRMEVSTAGSYDGVIYSYNHNHTAPFIDMINSKLVTALPIFRWTRWKGKHLLLLFLIMFHNSFRLLKLYLKYLKKEDESVQDDKNFQNLMRITSSWKQFREELKNALCFIPVNDSVDHEVVPIHSAGLLTKYGKTKTALKCGFCEEKAKSTRSYCKTCQTAICHSCMTNGNHMKYGSLSKVLRNQHSGHFHRRKSLFRDFLPVTSEDPHIQTTSTCALNGSLTVGETSESKKN